MQILVIDSGEAIPINSEIGAIRLTKVRNDLKEVYSTRRCSPFKNLKSKVGQLILMLLLLGCGLILSVRFSLLLKNGLLRGYL